MRVPDDRIDACEVVRRLGGTARWSQLTRYSTAHSVRLATAAGGLRRVGRGVYALPGAGLSEIAATRTRGLVSHQTAARHWKLESLGDDGTAHVTVPVHKRVPSIRGVTLHYADVPALDDHGGVTSPLRTVLDCALTLAFADALSIADSALRLALFTPDDLITRALARRGAGRRRVVRVASAADALAANCLESTLRAVVLDAGITGFEPQYQVALPRGPVWVDLGDPRRRIALEADSFAFHGSPEALLRDCGRYDELVRHGWLVLRFGYEHVALEREWVAAVVADTCALRRDPRQRTRTNL